MLCIPILLWVLSSCNQDNKFKQPEKHSTSDSFYTGKEIIYIPEKENYYKDQVFTEKLKGGYEIYYTRSKDFKNIYLRNGSVSKKLNTLPIDEGSYFSLGVVLNDFDNYFVLGHDNGNSTPYTVELIEKKNAKNMLEHEVFSIEGRYSEENLVYCDTSTEYLKEKVILFNLRSKKKEYFDFSGITLIRGLSYPVHIFS